MMHNKAIGSEEFSALLASSIHDIKNSIGLVITSLDELSERIEDRALSRAAIDVQYHAKRVSGDLIHLLALYKMNQGMLGLNLAENNVYDLLEDRRLYDAPVLEARNLDIEIRCEPDLTWCFDRDLVSGIISNALANAIRHARHRLLLEAGVGQGGLVIALNDDGPGVPQDLPAGDLREGRIDFLSGSTGLGLYFSEIVAGLHRKDGEVGRITLVGGGELGGACFSLRLP